MQEDYQITIEGDRVLLNLDEELAHYLLCTLRECLSGNALDIRERIFIKALEEEIDPQPEQIDTYTKHSDNDDELDDIPF
jgi:hypothetical protein